MTAWPRFCAPTLAAVAVLGLPGAAQACGTPTDQWYFDVSDVVFEASAICDVEQRTCRLRVSNVLRNPDGLGIESRPFEVDYQNWYRDYYATHPDTIVLACGVPLFEPDSERFQARFYANLDAETSELIVRRADIRGAREWGR